jgi:hypothetical protein
MRIARLALVTLVLLRPASTIAQSHPDFSGTWVEDESARKTTMAVPNQGGKAMTLPPRDTVVTQSAATLTTEQTFMSQVVRYVYRLDGKESVNHNGANTLTTKSGWEEKKLVTQGTSFSVTSAGESLWLVKETRWLDPSGAMVVDTSYKDEAGKTDTTTRVFRKKK